MRGFSLIKKALKQDNVDLFLEKIIQSLDDKQITQFITRQTSLNKVLNKDNKKNKRLKDVVQTIMTEAVKLGSVRILKYLIDILGVDPNVVNRGRTLLRWAALQEKPSLEMVRYLLDHPRIDLQSDAATLPFDIMFIIGELQDDAGTYRKDKLRGMIYPHYRIRKYTEILLLFLEKVLTRDPEYVNQQDHYGKTLLWVAAHYGLSNVVELLLSYGADYIKDYNPKTTSKGTLNRGGGGAPAPEGTSPLQETLLSKRGNWNRCQQLFTQVEKFNTLVMKKHLWDASHMYDQQKSRHGQQVAREKLLGSTYRSAASVSHKFPIVWAAASTQQQEQEQETKKKQTRAVLRYIVQRMKNQHVKELSDLLRVNRTRAAPRISNPPHITNQEIQRIKAIRRYLSDENPQPDQLSGPQIIVIRKARKTIRAKNPDNSDKGITQDEKLKILIRAYSDLLQQEYSNDQRWKDIFQVPYDGPLLSLGGGGGGGN